VSGKVTVSDATTVVQEIPLAERSVSLALDDKLTYEIDVNP